jgi:hypothetical protein
MEMNITFHLLNDDATTHDVSQCQGSKWPNDFIENLVLL